ncbi:MAG: type II secretion system F family protein [Armatimonadetes bacterium]|nr:type II secretion system F family protein [Armatimonadota bacterium]
MFTRQLAAMLSAGIQLHQALLFYAQGDTSPLCQVMEKTAARLAAGSSLSQALRRHPAVFSPVYVGLVEVGESSGKLVHVFNRLADLLEKQVTMRKRVSAVLTYPAILLLISVLAMLSFLLFVLPMMAPIFESLRIPMPLATRILLASRIVIPVGGVILLLAAAVLWLARPWLRRYYREHPAALRRLHQVPLSMPVLGAVLLKLITARVLYSLATMLDAGLTLVSSLHRAAGVAGNAGIAARMEDATRDVIEGRSVAEALKRHRVFPSGAVQLISVGEESAGLNAMLRHIASIYDAEVELALMNLAAVVEPVIMVTMGALVAFVVLSAVLPTIYLLNNL